MLRCAFLIGAITVLAWIPIRPVYAACVASGSNSCASCSTGTFGNTCSNTCTCQNGVCNGGLFGNGLCSNCTSGYYGVNCDAFFQEEPFAMTWGPYGICAGLFFLAFNLWTLIGAFILSLRKSQVEEERQQLEREKVAAEQAAKEEEARRRVEAEEAVDDKKKKKKKKRKAEAEEPQPEDELGRSTVPNGEPVPGTSGDQVPEQDNHAVAHGAEPIPANPDLVPQPSLEKEKSTTLNGSSAQGKDESPPLRKEPSASLKKEPSDADGLKPEGSTTLRKEESFRKKPPIPFKKPLPKRNKTKDDDELQELTKEESLLNQSATNRGNAEVKPNNTPPHEQEEDDNLLPKEEKTKQPTAIPETAASAKQPEAAATQPTETTTKPEAVKQNPEPAKVAETRVPERFNNETHFPAHFPPMKYFRGNLAQRQCAGSGLTPFTDDSEPPIPPQLRGPGERRDRSASPPRVDYASRPTYAARRRDVEPHNMNTFERAFPTPSTEGLPSSSYHHRSRPLSSFNDTPSAPAQPPMMSARSKSATIDPRYVPQHTATAFSSWSGLSVSPSQSPQPQPHGAVSGRYYEQSAYQPFIPTLAISQNLIGATPHDTPRSTSAAIGTVPPPLFEPGDRLRRRTACPHTSVDFGGSVGVAHPGIVVRLSRVARARQLTSRSAPQGVQDTWEYYVSGGSNPAPQRDVEILFERVMAPTSNGEMDSLRSPHLSRLRSLSAAEEPRMVASNYDEDDVTEHYPPRLSPRGQRAGHDSR